MNVRPASFRDLGRIEDLHRLATEDSAAHPTLGSDSPVPQTVLVRIWYGVSKALSSLVPLSDSDASLLVAEDADGSVIGFVQAQGVPGQPKAWHVVNLCVEPSARGHFAQGQLLASLCTSGSEHGVTRFVVRIPIGHPALSLLLELGFNQYATEQILFRDDSGAEPRLRAEEGAGVLRPVRREDVGAIHLLYLRATPSHVARVEGPTLKAWQAAFCSGSMTRIGRDDWRHFVAERPGVVAWAGLRPASRVRPGLLALMCDGQDGRLRDEVVDAALAMVPPGPMTSVLRHYDSELIRALQTRGFEILGAQLLLVRDLAVKVRIPAVSRRKKQRLLVPAGMARAVPQAVASASQQRARPSSSHR